MLQFLEGGGLEARPRKLQLPLSPHGDSFFAPLVQNDDALCPHVLDWECMIIDPKIAVKTNSTRHQRHHKWELPPRTTHSPLAMNPTFSRKLGMWRRPA